MKMIKGEKLRLKIEEKGPKYSLNTDEPRKNQRHIAMVNYAEKDALELAQRIVACVNACDGMETRSLEGLSISNLLEHGRIGLQELHAKLEASEKLVVDYQKFVFDLGVQLGEKHKEEQEK